LKNGGYYGMEMNVEKTKVTRISRRPSPVTIKIDQKKKKKKGKGKGLKNKER